MGASKELEFVDQVPNRLSDYGGIRLLVSAREEHDNRHFVNLIGISEDKFISVDHTLLRKIKIAERVTDHAICSRIVDDKIWLESIEGCV